ncbi:glycosyltransferase family 4 protein [Ramlibacter rhizophilus]|nr:glycosyltransferase family 4 protein [Ramlibacter rhizophilus]
MKILMLSPDAQMIDRRILQEAHSLQALGHQVTVLSGFECREPDAYQTTDGVIVKRYVYDWQDRRLLALRGRHPLAWRLLWPFMRVRDRLLDRPAGFDYFVLEKALEHEFDVVHVHDYPALRPGVMAAQARGVPVVYDSHEFYPVQSSFTPAQQKRHLARERRLVRECVQVITVNPYLARMIAREHGIDEPMVILNACPWPAPQDDALVLRADEPARAARRREFGIPPDAFTFLYQGWLSPERNLDVMVRAIARVPSPAALVVVGYGDYRAVLENLATELGVADRVHFLGRIESEALVRLTPACDVGLIPYAAVDEMHRYCSPNKLFEFVMAGLPVIANDLPYLRDVVAGHDFGWLGELESVDALSSMMAQALASPDRLQQYATHAIAARQQLNWDREAAQLAALYARLEAAAQPAPPAQVQALRTAPANSS